MGRAKGVMVRNRIALIVAFAFLAGALATVAKSWELAAELASLAVAAVGYWLAWGSARLEEAKVRGDEKGLWVNERLVLPREAIKSGRVVERRERPPRVDLRARGLRLGTRVVASDVKGARALLQALGIDRREGTRRFTLPGWLLGANTTIALAMFGGVFISTLALTSTPHVTRPALAVTMTLATLALLVVRALTRVTITIAKDGVSLERWGRSEFIRFDAIDSLERARGTGKAGLSPGFFIRLKTGRTIKLYTLGERMRGEDMYIGDHVMTALEKAMRSVRHGEAIRMLERGGRSPKEWLGSLRSAAESRSYREVPVAPKDLFDVLSDASASDEMRSASAAVLASLNDPKIKKRLRVAAEDIASPRVRVTIDAALSSDEEEILSALEAASEQS